MPGAALSISTTRSRRRWYASFITSMLSCGPLRASTAAAWLTLLVLLVLWLCSLSMALMSGTGAAA